MLLDKSASSKFLELRFFTCTTLKAKNKSPRCLFSHPLKKNYMIIIKNNQSSIEAFFFSLSELGQILKEVVF